MNQDTQHVHFVTGRLAERAVRDIVASVADEFRFEYSISVLPITVAALMTPKWLLRHLQIPDQADRVVLPGHLHDELELIRHSFGQRIECGPRDIRDLPTFFGGKRLRDAGYGKHSIEIIAEINHAGRLTSQELIETAQRLVRDGADVIDIGCTPGYQWNGVGDAVKLLVDHQVRVSIDSFD
ncbi:MAG: dihydropteroate synthase, partial [Planctomycetales bacterium]|nr:dihydropteroate synthase [Planctomycetales bacterium]